MSIQDAFFPRGKVAGVFPTLTTRSDEAYVEFIEDARNILMHAQQRPIGAYSQQLIEAAGIGDGTDRETTRAAIDLLMDDPTLKTYYRIKRSLQEAFWSGLSKSFNQRRDDILAALDEADASGPGTVEYADNWQDTVPDYAAREIHIQPGG